MESYPATQQEFATRVIELATKHKISFVLAVYQLVDTLTSQKLARDGPQLACGRGCSFCCHQLVTCTAIEWNEIKIWFRSRERERKDAGRKARQTWGSYFKANSLRLQLSQNPLAVHGDWSGKPCIFLDRAGECTIYPVRPIDCRTLTSTNRCTSWEERGARRFRFEWELWANNLIMEEQKRQSGRMETTPLSHWAYISF